MTGSLGVISARGKSIHIKLIELITKHAYVEVLSIQESTGGGELNMFIKGTVGQVEEAISAATQYVNQHGIEAKYVIKHNFDFQLMKYFK